ncbi:hypothetical protein [Mongoliimonas terrestris]|uniref:hypothetical protein n=1 Tax=Mongoliimonas terrestris TaxID=1709001 RepID=UPI000AC7AE30|nr:hypothetical protein [Mongoliimonas terrestris]
MTDGNERAEVVDRANDGADAGERVSGRPRRTATQTEIDAYREENRAAALAWNRWLEETGNPFDGDQLI